MSDMSRQEMLEQHLRPRGIRDPVVLAVMARVPREAFVPPAFAAFAYDDRPLPIAGGQTISQPYIVALMAEALELSSNDRVLEIGTGSGYAAAVLAELAGHVYTVERHPVLATTAIRTLRRLGYHNVTVRCADGTLGWRAHAPFQAIAVAAGGPEVPQTLVDQLAMGGRLVMPIGSPLEQTLVRVTRLGTGDFAHDNLGGVQFVPLIGARGWHRRRAPTEVPTSGRK